MTRIIAKQRLDSMHPQELVIDNCSYILECGLDAIGYPSVWFVLDPKRESRTIVTTWTGLPVPQDEGFGGEFDDLDYVGYIVKDHLVLHVFVK